MSALSSTLPTPLDTRPASPRHVHPRDITDPDQIAVQLSLLSRKQQDLSYALNALVSDRAQIESAFARLENLSIRADRLSGDIDGRQQDQAQPQPNGGALGLSSRGLGQQNGDFEQEQDDGLVERVRKVWDTSERVGGKVRRLDEEVGRVREATDIVTEVLELKNALASLSTAIAKQDWESASRSCKRAMSVRQQVIDGNFAGHVVPTAQFPQPPANQLSELREVLLHTFRTEFDSAAQRKDQQAVSRFFRLWPGIGAENEGLEAYGDFVVGLVKSRGSNAGKPSSPLYYLTQLTSLLESIAHIIDQHQPVVDKYYGKGRMRTVVGRLVGESDRVVRNLVEGWEEERRVGRLISETKQTSFGLLSQPNLLPPLFSSLVNHSTGQMTLSSLASSTTSALPNLSSTAGNLLQSYTKGGQRQAPAPTQSPAAPVEEEEKGPDSRDVDRVLGELVALGGRWALFKRFVWGRLSDDEDDDDEAERNNPKSPANGHDEESAEAGPSDPDVPEPSTDMAVLDQSGSQRAIENLLRVYYEPLELWFLRVSIEKAHRLDSPELASQPHLSSILDDTFYLLKLVVQRVLSIGSISTLRSMRHRITEVIERDYLNIIKKKMDGVYTVPAGGQDRAERDRREKDQKAAFIIYLNDLDVSGDYIERLMDEISHNLPQVFVQTDLPVVKEELQALANMASRFRSTSKNGLDTLFNQLTKPRLRSLLDDIYKDVTYLLDDDSFAEAEELDIVRKRFIRAWESLIDGYRNSFTDHNYQTFFSMTLEMFVRPWEKLVMGMKFTELGAIRYERDVRGVANYLSAQTSFGGARDKFVRLQQISTVLNLDADEDAEEFWSNAGIPWRLSKTEYNALLDQRL